MFRFGPTELVIVCCIGIFLLALAGIGIALLVKLFAEKVKPVNCKYHQARMLFN